MVTAIKAERNIKKEFSAFLRDNKRHSQNGVARALGLNPSALSQYKKGTYAGDNEKLDSIIGTWLNEQSKRVKRKIKLVETTAFNRIYAACQEVHDTEECLGIIVGPAGCGKSFTLKQYVKDFPDSLLIYCDTDMTANDIIKKLAHYYRLNINGKSIFDIKEEIAAAYNEKRVRIIMDEADRLAPKVIDTIRRLIVDQAEGGITLVGVRQLMTSIHSYYKDFNQVKRRIKVSYNVEENKDDLLTLPETRQIVKTVFHDIEVKNELMKYFHTRSQKKAGYLSVLVEKAYKLYYLNNADLDEDIIDAAAQTIEALKR